MGETSHRTYWQGGTGTWSNGTYWSNGVASTALNGTIGVVDPFASGFTVTLPAGITESPVTLLLDDDYAAVVNDGTLGSYGGITIAGGTLINNGVLDGPVSVQFGGTLIESGQALVSLTGALTLDGGRLEIGDTSSPGVVLTNAVGSDITASGTIVPIYTTGVQGNLTSVSNLTVENAGTIAVGLGSVLGEGLVGLTLDTGVFDNTGLITASDSSLFIDDFGVSNAAGATIAGYGSDISLLASFDNAGLITVNGGTLELTGGYAGSTFTNTGTIAATNAVLELGGDPTVADLAGITLTRSSLVVIGTIENTGNSIGAGAGILQGATIGSNYQTGTIAGGTVDVGAAGLDLVNADFDGVTLSGGLTLNSGNATLSNGTGLGGVTVDGGTLTIEPLAGADITQGVDLIRGVEAIHGSFTLSTPVSVGAGAYLALGGGGGIWTNQSTVTVGAGGTLALHGDETAADLGAIVDQGGIILLSGTIANAGQTLGMAGSELTGATLQGGTIIGGDVLSDGITLSGGVIDGATILGGLTIATAPDGLTGPFTELTLANGAVVDQAPGVIATVSLGVQASDVTVEGTGGVGQPFVVTAGNLDVNGNVTLTAPIVLDGSLAGGTIDSGFTTLAESWTNASTLTVENGAQLTLGGSVSSADFGDIVAQGGFVSFDGTLVNTGLTLDRASTGLAALTLANGGTIVGGTIAQSAGFSLVNGSDFEVFSTSALGGIDVLDGVTVLGGLDVTTGTLALTDGSAVLDAAGTASEAVTVGGGASLIDLVAGSSLALAGFDLAGGTLMVADTSGTGLMLDNAAGTNYTLGGVISDLTGIASYLGGNGFGATIAHPVTMTNEGGLFADAGSLAFGPAAIAVDSLINTGLISVTGAGLAIDSALFNQGTIAGSTTGVTLAQGFDNAGLITVSGGSLVLGGSGGTPGAPGSNVLQSWSNTGTIAADGAVVTLGGDVALAAIGSLSLTDSTLVLDGHIENFSQTLAPTGAATVLAGATLAGAVFVGGAIDFGGFGFDAQDAVIDNATIVDGLTLATGAVTLINGSEVLAPGGGSLATVLVDGAGATFGIDVARPGTVAQPIDVTAGEASISGVFTLTGALDASGAGATIALLGEAATGAPGWINAGTVSVSGGASLLLGGDETAVDIGSIANQGGSIVFVAGTLDNAGQTLGVSDPSLTGLTLAGGTIAGGAIDVAAERFAVAGDAVSDNAALDNVAVLGPLTVGSAIVLTLAGSTAVYAGAGSTAPGAITVGSTGLVDFDESTTPTLINDVTLEGGNISWSPPPPGGALVTPPVTAVIAAGVDVTGGGRLFTTYTAGQTLTNFGTIDAATSFGNYYLGIYGTSFTNQGAIDVGAGGALKVDATDGVNLTTIAATGAEEVRLEGARFSNQGTIVANGAILRVGGSFFSTLGTAGYTSFTNSGSISDTGGAVVLDGDFATNGLGSLTDTGSTVALVGGTIDNAGATLGSGSAAFQGLAMSGGTIAGGVLDQAGLGLTFSGSSPYGGFDPVLDNVDVTGGLTVGSFASLTIAGSTSIYAAGTGSAPGAVSVGSLGAVVFDQTLAPVLTNAVTLDDGGLAFGDPAGITYGTTATIGATIGAGDVVSGSGSIFSPGYGTALDITNLGTVIAATAPGGFDGFLEVSGQTFMNVGLVSVATSSQLAVNADFVNDGSVALDGGSIDFASAVTGPGVIDFTGSGGMVVFETAQSVAGPIANFAVGDDIQIDDFTADTATVTYVAGIGLELDNGTTVVTLAIEGNYSTSDFSVTQFGVETSIALTSDAPCFAAGTRILTTEGHVPVEALSVGDRVVLHGGGSAPVTWIGRRRVDLLRHRRPETVRPILIAAGAIADGVPGRDVYVSPDHAVALAGYLIPAKALLNGETIRQVEGRSVTYYHVELPAHGVLYAEGMPAESYLETGNRGAFENGGGAVTLHPDFAQTRREQTGCAPFAEAGPVVEGVRAGILARAGIATTDDPGLTVRRRRDGSVVIRSRCDIPGYLTADPRDRRRLGVKVGVIRLADGTAIPLDHPLLTAGWHDLEADGRWTDGAGVIPAALVGGRGRVTVETVATGVYAAAGRKGARAAFS